MKKRIIKIDQELCNGCMACVNACHEGAIALKDGKAYLAKSDYCDGLGDCLPVCPTNAISFVDINEVKISNLVKTSGCNHQCDECVDGKCHLNFPIKLELINEDGEFFENADVVLCADCSAFIYPNLYQEYLKGKLVLIACPKLGEYDYETKLAHIFKRNTIRSLTIVRMEVPCCSGLEYMVKAALKESNIILPVQVKIFSIKGEKIS